VSVAPNRQEASQSPPAAPNAGDRLWRPSNSAAAEADGMREPEHSHMDKLMPPVAAELSPSYLHRQQTGYGHPYIHTASNRNVPSVNAASTSTTSRNLLTAVRVSPHRGVPPLAPEATSSKQQHAPPALPAAQIRQQQHREVAASEVDTFDIMTYSSRPLLPVPGANATVEERVDFLHQQLDSIGVDKEIVYGLFLLGNGDNARLQGGVILPYASE
jgi:hypothetical protein